MHGRQWSYFTPAALHAFCYEVVEADTAADALQRLHQEAFDLVLVNRVFDADSDSGIDFIRKVKADESQSKTPVLLVSNYEDAQAQAVEAGAGAGIRQGVAAIAADGRIAPDVPALVRLSWRRRL